MKKIYIFIISLNIFFFKKAFGAEKNPTEALSDGASNALGKVTDMVQGFFDLLPNLVIGVVVVLIFWLLSTIASRLIHNPNKADTSGVKKVLARLLKSVIVILGFLVAAAVIVPSITPGKLLGALGFGSVAIGFAFKDILQNFLAGILILLREPFKAGDQVVLGDYEGTVEKIDTRSTFMKTYDGKKVLIPNGQVYTNPMVILTAYGNRRSEYDIGVGYGDDLNRTMEIILKTVKTVEGVSAEPKPDVLVSELAGSSVNIKARWWTDPKRKSVVNTDSAVKKAIKLALDEESIDMPYPTNVVLFHDQTEETDGDRTKQREGWPKGDNPPKPRPIMSNATAKSESKESR